MQLTYRCLIDKTVKELPSVEALAESYPSVDKDQLRSHINTAREILENAQTRAGALLYSLHCRCIYDSKGLVAADCGGSNVDDPQDFKLVFSVDNKGSVSEFYKIFSTESENLAKQEGFNIAREFSTEDSVWSLTSVEDEDGNVVCRVRNTALTPQLYKLTYLIKNSVSNQEELFYRVVSALSLKEVRIQSLALTSVFEFPSFNITAKLVAIEDEAGITVWQAQSEDTKD